MTEPKTTNAGQRPTSKEGVKEITSSPSRDQLQMLADHPVDRSVYEQQWPMDHPVELIACLEAEIKMLRAENARLARRLFDARYRDWL